ncbi:MAG: S-layer homology domain-containing protein [Acidobacteria bacterium]|nr:MAG: S-layer homology domain-containing protein [Acidobacteriota bacterium]
MKPILMCLVRWIGLVTTSLIVFSIPLAAKGWEWQNPLPQGNTLRSVCGSSAADVFAVGDGGSIIHYNGTAWSIMASGTTNRLNGVWASSASDVFAVGVSGTILHFDGTNWSAMTSGTTEWLSSVWGTSATDVFVTAGTAILHYDGTAWTAMEGSRGANDIWGSSGNDIFTVGNLRVISHYDGGTWTSTTPDIFNTNPITAVWGASGNDVFAAGPGASISHYNGTSWSYMASGTTETLQALWGSSGTNVYATGSNGKILHYNGISWRSENSGTASTLYGVWGSSADDVFAVGQNGTILHYGGSVWSAMSGTTVGFYGVWGSSANDVFAVGGVWNGASQEGTILHYDGSNWSAMTSGTTRTLFGIWGASGNDVFAVGDEGTILHYNGAAWTPMASGTFNWLRAVWGRSANDVYAVGGNGTILHYDGTAWSVMPTGTTDWFYGVWGSSSNDVVVVGGSIARYDGNQWWTLDTSQGCTSVWGTSSNDVFAVGTGGTIMHNDGGISWTSMNTGTETTLHGIWGSSASDIFAVGGLTLDGLATILHYDGTAWSPMASGKNGELFSIWGSSGSDVFCVGDGGTILHYANRRPLAAAGVDQIVKEGVTATLDGSGCSDADADTLTYAWLQTSGPSVTLNDPASAIPTFAAPLLEGGSNIVLEFELTLSDGTVTSAPDRVLVTVTPHTFTDVLPYHIFYAFIEKIAVRSITAGCGTGNYCPDQPVTRAQMAIFLEKAIRGSDFSPSPAIGVFGDVPPTHWAGGWIERLAADGITAGCGDGNFCPDLAVTRSQMAVFLLKATHGSSYAPPGQTGVFSDVPIGHWAGAWIEQLANEGITVGCGSGTFCPDAPVTRGQMAVFLTKTFGF